MDGRSRSGCDGESSSEVGIPFGLNRIKTRRVSSKDQRSSTRDESTESPTFGFSWSPLRQKQKTMAHGRGKASGSSKKGLPLFLSVLQLIFCFSVKARIGCSEKVGKAR